MVSSRTVLSVVLLASLTSLLGCASVWHDLKPHRMQRMNRGPAPSIDPEFSHSTRSKHTKLAKQDASQKPATMSVNSAEIATVRAQSPTAEFR